MNLVLMVLDMDWLKIYFVFGYDVESKVENDNYI